VIDTAPRPAGLPESIGRYRIIGRLGKGAMGVVYAARDDVIQRDVAIKVMMTDLEEEPETAARFFREAQITSKLVHRNIVTVFELGEDKGRPFIVMELLKGTTLTGFLREIDKDALEQKLDLMIQTCEGLAVAHAKGVVHRDIKPENLFVLPSGGLKILDFGVARLASSNMTASGLIVGTPDYMSPEQARGKEVDTRSDIFSVSAVFYLMVTGRRPFEGASLPVVLQKVVREDPLPIRPSEAPAALERIISRGFSKDPDKRYQKVADMAADLIRFKKYLDAETRQLATASRAEFDQILQAIARARDMRASLGAPRSSAASAQEAELRARFPFFAPAPADASRVAAPLRRAKLVEISRDLQAVLASTRAEVDMVQEAFAETELAEQALARGDGKLALTHFDRAAEVLSEDPPRIAEGREKARDLYAVYQVRQSQIDAYLSDARTAEKARKWEVVVDRCSSILGLDPNCVEATALAAQAQGQIAAEADARKQQVLRAISLTDAAIRRGRFEDAARALDEARAIDGQNHEILAADARLADARASAEAADLEARQTAEVAAARRAAADEERRAAIAALTIQCEAFWANGDVADALSATRQILSLDKSNANALRIQGLAYARIKEQADAANRASLVESRLSEARQLLRDAKLEKAERAIKRALDLDPANAEAASLLGDVRRREAEVAIAAERQAAERDQERQVEKILKTARRKMRARDYAAAAYAAEDALFISPEHAPSRALLAEARSALGLSRASHDKDGTVRRLASGRAGAAADPDDTVQVRGRVFGPKVLAAALGDWAAALRRRLQSRTTGS
jgi:serine/threonine protein kinase